MNLAPINSRNRYAVAVEGDGGAHRVFSTHNEAQHCAAGLVRQGLTASIHALRPHIFADERKERRDEDRHNAYLPLLWARLLLVGGVAMVAVWGVVWAVLRAI